MSVEKVKEYFSGTELEGKIIELGESSATVELAAHALSIEPDRIAKTLSYLVDEQPLVIVVSGMSRVDNKKYKAQFSKKAKMIPFEQVNTFIGHPPGGVCPFAVNQNVKVYLDKSLQKYTSVYPAAGSGNSAVELTIPQLEKFSRYESWVDVCVNGTEH